MRLLFYSVVKKQVISFKVTKKNDGSRTTEVDKKIL